ncbi:hypothetical protein BU14_0060s0042 [Porphyra umbilicalis]|uniref:Uncharacterized protein n=1 Tax=Porphyra umbilicalis TaxID=2786 RepID=A0A1X6PGT9_PORUM|nr:hypothetical protein BU14_0060s0042 [Porphyra umbilicalis]|eukprot:OSX80077.1 hypothetical protein BU14_0060s0042 [Porphyra umbilicalis]
MYRGGGEVSSGGQTMNRTDVYVTGRRRRPTDVRGGGRVRLDGGVDPVRVPRRRVEERRLMQQRAGGARAAGEGYMQRGGRYWPGGAAMERRRRGGSSEGVSGGGSALALWAWAAGVPLMARRELVMWATVTATERSESAVLPGADGGRGSGSGIGGGGGGGVVCTSEHPPPPWA